MLRTEISVLKIIREENVELSEEETLKQLRDQYEDLTKGREEQEERLERVRQRNRDLNERHLASQKEIADQIDSTRQLEDQIKQTHEHKLEKERQKAVLNEETKNLRTEIEEQRKVLEERQGGVQRVKQETEEAKLHL
jgi:chromosome segregation ATPase